MRLTEKDRQTLAKPLADELAVFYKLLDKEIQKIIFEGATPDMVEKKIEELLS